MASTKLANLKGPRGIQGLKGDQGVKGDDGSNVLPTDVAIANALSKPAARDTLELSDYADQKSWFAAIANRANRAINVGILGASLAEGYRVTSYDRTIEGRLAYLLNTHHPTPGLTTHGRGYIGVPTIGGSGVKATQAGVDGWPQIYNGGSFDDAVFNIGSKHRCWYTTATTASVVHTFTEGATSADILYATGSGGVAAGGSWQKNAGAVTTFNTLSGAVTPVKLNLPVAFAAGDTLTLKTTTNGKAFLFSGIREYNGDETKGFQVHNFGHAGWNFLQWAQGGAAAAVFVEIAAFGLDLLILPDALINDAATLNGNMSAATAKTNLIAFIALLRSAGITCPIQLGAGHDIFGAASGVYSVDPWASYVTAMKEISDTVAGVVFGPDNSQRLPRSNDANNYGLLNGPTDLLHSNPNGALYLAYAENLYAAIAPR